MQSEHETAPTGAATMPSRPGLHIARWAHDLGQREDGDGQLLGVALGPRPVPMADSRATGKGMATNGQLGGDVIRLAAGDAFSAHTHPGDHLLIVLAGAGTIVLGDTVYPTHAGELYVVDGGVPHAVGAITDHVILAVGAPHKPVDAPDRMTVLEYLAVAAEFPRLHCRICDRAVAAPALLHDVACPHCPCPTCAASDHPQAQRP